MSFDQETNKSRPLDTVTFFYITREGTPGILYVGLKTTTTVLSRVVL
ncbi:hypothetical protein [Gimesia chilikensis]|uniref:Uncharacterized protein n=1 Tax=Gimesia chilikensis TaxID=2605989 RepID=A0A517PSS3_9PLAN|nr:hypothetical protein [Gimesia chilikensis]QDT22424.1 hypothetical protein HG66A1_42320 [Gimesia chilikensis]QDT86364.1 hypothetical protein MalM14_40400 [Gimesia chilikensis]